jgi:hypothetical protein
MDNFKSKLNPTTLVSPASKNKQRQYTTAPAATQRHLVSIPWRHIYGADHWDSTRSHTMCIGSTPSLLHYYAPVATLWYRPRTHNQPGLDPPITATNELTLATMITRLKQDSLKTK